MDYHIEIQAKVHIARNTRPTEKKFTNCIYRITEIINQNGTAAFDCFNGTYTIINTREIPDDQWYENQLWEGALCYTIPSDRMKEWVKPNLFTI